MAGDLCQHGGDVLLYFEISVLDEESTNPPKVNRRKEILQIDIENPPPMAVLSCIRDDRPLTFESVGSPVLELPRTVDVVEAILQQVGKLPLQAPQSVNWRINRALPAVLLRNLKGGVLLIRGQLVQNVCNSFRLVAE